MRLVYTPGAVQSKYQQQPNFAPGFVTLTTPGATAGGFQNSRSAGRSLSGRGNGAKTRGRPKEAFADARSRRFKVVCFQRANPADHAKP